MDPVIAIVAGVLLVWAIIATSIALRSKSEVGKLASDNGRLSEESRQYQALLESSKYDTANLQQLRIEKAEVDQELDDNKKLLDKMERSLNDERAAADKKHEELQNQVRGLEADKRGVEHDLENAEKSLEEHGNIVKEAKESFKVLSTQTLEQQQKSFMENAGQSLRARQEAVEKLVKPLAEKIDTLDKARVATAVEFREQMKVLAQTNQDLATEAEALASALKRPEVRGRWGETHLERVLELSGLKKDIDYTVQETFTVDGGRLRTDIIVHMPNDRSIVLDSKVSMVGILDAFNTTDDVLREEAMERHLAHVKDHIDTLHDKKYWEVLASTPDMVIMVLPEFAFLPAVEREPSLTERALRKNVIIVTPPALLALLKAVELTWQQIKVAETAKQISDLGRELHRDLLRYANNAAKVGRGLQSAVNGYNDSVATFEGSILGRARRFNELGVTLSQETSQMKEVTVTPRHLASLPENHLIENTNGSPESRP